MIAADNNSINAYNKIRREIQRVIIKYLNTCFTTNVYMTRRRYVFNIVNAIQF